MAWMDYVALRFRDRVYHFCDRLADAVINMVVDWLRPWWLRPRDFWVSQRRKDETIARALLLGMEDACYPGGPFAHDGPGDQHWVCFVEFNGGEYHITAATRYQIAKKYLEITGA